jgi:hypothetical protein
MIIKLSLNAPNELQLTKNLLRVRAENEQITVCNYNVFVNAPYFDTFAHRLRGADGLPWWSPSQVLHHQLMCAVCVCVCTALSSIYCGGPSW